MLPGEQALITAQKLVEKIEELPKKVERLVSWRAGRIYFEDDPISTVLQEVNRYLAQEVVVEDPDVAKLTVTGIFKTGDLESVSSMFRDVYGLQVKEEGKQLVLYKP